MKKNITVDDVMALRPCYDRETIRGFFGRRKTLTPLQVCRLKKVSKGDKFWLLLCNGYISKCDMRLLACDFAEHTLHYFEREHPEDNRPRETIKVARKYARGKATIEVLRAARAAAYDAAAGNAAAYAAAAGAAAAADAADATAYAAAFAAAGAAYAAYAADADDADENKWQLNHLIKYFKKRDGK